MDSAAGRLLGHTLGSYFVHRCRPGQPSFNARTFDGTQYKAGVQPLDFTGAEPLANGTFNQLTGANTTLQGSSAILQKLWTLAANEWA